MVTRSRVIGCGGYLPQKIITNAELADRLRTSIQQTLNTDGVRTGDLGGNATTSQFTAALLERIAHA